MSRSVVPLLLASAHLFCAESSPRADPVANPEAVIVRGRARFTILSEILVRLELSKDAGGIFDDRATFYVRNRHLLVPQFSVTDLDESTVVIATSRLRLTYNGSKLWPARDRGFSPQSLSIAFVDSAAAAWRPGKEDSRNLKGTMDHAPPGFAGGWDCYSTPDECSEAYPKIIGDGLVSRNGWAIVNDTNTTRFATASSGEIAWLDGPSTRASNRPLVDDVYFLGAGSDYVAALATWASISGRPALPPMAAFGVWFSHYTVFAADEYIADIVEGYESRGLPLNVAVLDVPWHYDRYNDSISPAICNNWGGFTPNATLFPDLPAFMKEMHRRGLKVILSNHMQVGISSCEEHYEDFARALHLPSSFVERKEVIQCALDNRTWVEAFFKTILDSPTLISADHWWNDFPGCSTEVTGWDAQAPATNFWSNYVFDLHKRMRSERSVLLARYGGLGSQNHGIGFSGDVFQNFSTLAAEIQLTPTASNVLFGYWSHDIGGFHNGTNNPGDNDPGSAASGELFLRWVQWGVFSPIFRTHGEPLADRYLWDFSTFKEMKELLLLRNALVPYIYTMAWTAYKSAVSLLRPMYYSFPNREEAYTFTAQYMFGEHVLAAPISAPVGDDGTVVKSVWLPPVVTSWLTWDGSLAYESDTVLRQNWKLTEVPIFVPSGTILPMRSMRSMRSTFADPLVWVVWVGSATDGVGHLYEDEGDNFNYENSAEQLAVAGPSTIGWATTSVSFTKVGKQLVFHFEGTQGTYAGQPSSRSLTLQLRGLASVAPLGLRVDDQPFGEAAVIERFAKQDDADPVHSWVEPEGAVVIDLGRHGLRKSFTVTVTDTSLVEDDELFV